MPLRVAVHDAKDLERMRGDCTSAHYDTQQSSSTRYDGWIERLDDQEAYSDTGRTPRAQRSRKMQQLYFRAFIRAREGSAGPAPSTSRARADGPFTSRADSAAPRTSSSRAGSAAPRTSTSRPVSAAPRTSTSRTTPPSNPTTRAGSAAPSTSTSTSTTRTPSSSSSRRHPELTLKPGIARNA